MTGEPLDDTVRPPKTDDAGFVGTRIDNKYDVIEELGRGGMGVVYLGRHQKIGRDVALKVLLSSLSSSDRVRERFIREAQATGRVDHPNVVQVWDVGLTEGGAPFMVMELLRGEPLSARLERERRLPLADALMIARQLLSGLSAAHAAGVVHRDVKPENIVLRDGVNVKIVDFGVARVLGAGVPAITQQGDLVGTPGYFAPEQGQGAPVDERSDVWAATVVLYEMTTGELPFEGRNVVETLAAVANAEPRVPSEIRPYLPKRLDLIIRAGLEKDPEKRANMETLLGLVKRLERKLEGQDLTDTEDMPAVPKMEPSDRPSRPRELDQTQEDEEPRTFDE